MLLQDRLQQQWINTDSYISTIFDFSADPTAMFWEEEKVAGKARMIQRLGGLEGSVLCQREQQRGEFERGGGGVTDFGFRDLRSSNNNDNKKIARGSDLHETENSALPQPGLGLGFVLQLGFNKTSAAAQTQDTPEPLAESCLLSKC